MTHVTIDNKMHALHIDVDRMDLELMGALAPGLEWRLAQPSGYHWSGRYLALQGGSNTRRNATLVQDINESTGEWYVLVFYLESLEAYFDRISR